jgi:EAL and modified HD-GYP domain-containing signal transduction protein
MSAVPAVALPEPSCLQLVDLNWQPIIGRDQRPIGVRLNIVRGAAAGDVPAVELLAGVLNGFVAADDVAFPHGLVLLAAQGLPLDASLANWRPPRNVMLEVAADSLADAQQLQVAADLQRHGVRLVLNAAMAMPPSRLPLRFQYVVQPATTTTDPVAGSGVLATGAGSRDAVQAAFVRGAHAMIGWPLEEPVPEAPGTLQPAQKTVLELIRLLRADADAKVLERAFDADPVLAYLLLTLANSPAFRRGHPISSIAQAITLLGYRRLQKWLVLLLVIASKGSRALPQIYVAVARGFFMENLAEARRDLTLRDDCFVAGAFSLLGRITGIELEQLLEEVQLPPTIVQAVLHGEGPAGQLLALARALEGGQARPAMSEAGVVNTSLLRALAGADALQNLV